MKENNGYLTMSDVKKYTTLSASTIHRARKSGKLRSFRPGGRKLLFKVDDVDRWIKGERN